MHKGQICQLGLDEWVDEAVEVATDEQAEIVNAERCLALRRSLYDHIAVAGKIQRAEIIPMPELIFLSCRARRNRTPEERR